MPAQFEKTEIRVEGLSKTLGHQTVLDGVDLVVRADECVAVLGRSGTGKSVLLKLIIGLLQPDQGSVEIEGENIAAIPPEKLNEIRKGIGFLFQSGALYDSLTVEENVAFPLRRHMRISDRERNEKVEQLLEEVGMKDAIQKLPDELSGGMKKRVGLARALAMTPRILLLDEPTAGLDPLSAGEINELICKLRNERKAASIIVTHDMHSAKTVSTRVAMLHQGKILVEGPFEELAQSDLPVVSHFMKHSF